MFKLEKRFSSLFAAEHHNSTFNTVHIIAAVVGVLCALLVGFSILCIYKRKKKLKCIKHDLNNEKTVLNQFSLDLESPKPALLADSPMRQQQQLQIRLQQQLHIPNSSSHNPPPPYCP